MLVNEITEATQVWSKKGTRSVRKYRCTAGIRKGRVMSSPAACNKPLDAHKSASFKQTKAKKLPAIKFKSRMTKRSNPASKRNVSLNRAIKPKRSRRKIR
jgi:hypothetical protein